MRYFNRQLAGLITKAVKTFPAILIMGPRQAGKTTLLRREFGDNAKFVSLEEPDKRLWAKEDPVSFLDNYSAPVIIDEFQYVPELLPYIKERIDRDRNPGSYFLTGSQQFQVMKNVSESLAGRIAVTTLLPFSLSEMNLKYNKDWNEWFTNLTEGKGKRVQAKPGDIMINGLYPELVANRQVDRNLWFSSYIQTYLERDVKTLYDIGNLDRFSRFATLLAARCGSILNYSTYASDLGVSVPTIKSWFSILEASFVVFRLLPYYKNIGNRLIKSPKFYFYDTGLAAYLAGINSPDYLVHGSMAGQFFENLVVSEFFKNRTNFNENLNMFFVNDRRTWEIDLVIERNMKLIPVEIKLASTISSSHLENFKKLREKADNVSPDNYLICGQSEAVRRSDSIITSWTYL